MNIKKCDAGSIIFNKGDTSDTLSIIVDGSVKVSSPYMEDIWEKGCLLGTIGYKSVTYSFTYTAVKPVTLYQYDYNSPEDLGILLEGNASACALITYCYLQKTVSLINKYHDIYAACQYLYETILDEKEKYIRACEAYHVTPKDIPGLEQLAKYSSEKSVDEWMIDYYMTIGSYSPTRLKAFIEEDAKTATGIIMKAAIDIPAIIAFTEKISRYLDMMCDIFISDYRIDLFTYYVALLEEAIVMKAPIGPAAQMLDGLVGIMEQQSRIDKNLLKSRLPEYHGLVPAAKEASSLSKQVGSMNAEVVDQIRKEVKGSLDIILDYSGVDDSTKMAFAELIKKYTALTDRSGADDTARMIRKQITAGYYEIYRSAFFKSLSDSDIPAVLKMFFYFGYVDENLAGIDNTIFLYYLAETLNFNESKNVYTFYSWLSLIYKGIKDPSVNEFNVDYVSYLRTLKTEKRITEAEESAALRNGTKRVNYELENMFRSTSKMISGHVTTFCPVFSDHEIYKPLNTINVRDDDVISLLDSIRDKDYSLFYRETVYAAPEIGITKEVVQVEVLPEIIIMPGLGMRGAMWQEITGKKRTSPGRFVLPMFLLDELTPIMLRMCGEFRWELCRRIQGVRWNDLSERSLTSDYCDYLETFKRSHDISPEVKEKIKNSYRKFRNSSKEMFVHDYVDYLRFESNGSLRLNKLSRAILFTYCPFSRKVRESVSANQNYREMVDRYTVKRAQLIHLSDLVMQKIQKTGKTVPQPILDHRRFLEK